MLKVRNNADLKELEKLGFTENEFYYTFVNHCHEPSLRYWDSINIDKMDRTIEISSLSNGYIEDKIFELIQAGLVERV